MIKVTEFSQEAASIVAYNDAVKQNKSNLSSDTYNKKPHTFVLSSQAGAV